MRASPFRHVPGFGSVVPAEGKLADARVLDALNATSLGTTATVGGVSDEEVTTPLVNAFVWTAGGVF